MKKRYLAVMAATMTTMAVTAFTVQDAISCIIALTRTVTLFPLPTRAFIYYNKSLLLSRGI